MFTNPCLFLRIGGAAPVDRKYGRGVEIPSANKRQMPIVMDAQKTRACRVMTTGCILSEQLERRKPWYRSET